MLTACAGFSVVDEKGYGEAARLMPKQFESHGLPLTGDAGFQMNRTPYASILFKQLSPNFMQGQVATYYLGDTFAQTLQPRRSAFSPSKNGFVIEHLTQRIHLTMLAVCDWNNDGDEEWLVSCMVRPKRGGHEKTWFLLVPPPRNAQEILKGNPIAIRDCVGQSCTFTVLQEGSIRRMEENTMPLTDVTDVKPGEKTVTSQPKAIEKEDTVLEKSL